MRRGLLAGSIAALFGRLFAFTSPTYGQTMTTSEATVAPERSKQKAGKDAIRRFRVNFPEAQLTDLRRRIKATKWPDREQVADASQGVQLATTQKLARYWATEHDWGKCEAKLKALPNFVT